MKCFHRPPRKPLATRRQKEGETRSRNPDVSGISVYSKKSVIAILVLGAIRSQLIVMLLLLFPVSLFGIEWQTEGLYKSYYYRYRESLFNPNNSSVDLLGLHKGNNYYFSQYVSFQAELLSVLWQMDLLGKSTYYGKWKSDLRAKQFYFQKDFLQNWGLMIGRAILRWGTGYAFNPTDVVAPEKELSDPENSEKKAEGSDMAKLEYFGETYSVALCYLTHLDFGSKFKAKGSKLAFRFYKNLWNVDISLYLPHE